MIDGSGLLIIWSSMNLANNKVLVVAVVCSIAISLHLTKRVESMIRARYSVAPAMLYVHVIPWLGSKGLLSSEIGFCFAKPDKDYVKM